MNLLELQASVVQIDSAKKIEHEKAVTEPFAAADLCVPTFSFLKLRLFICQ
jgi:hypothetical protein